MKPLLIAFLFLAGLPMQAQDLNLKGKLNFCKAYFDDTTGKSTTHFKSVTRTWYSYPDTAKANKTLTSKTICTYGKLGEALSMTQYELNADSVLQMIDSTDVEYSDNYHRIRITRYKQPMNWDYSSGTSDELFIYDDRYNLIWDSNWTTENSRKYRYTNKYKYDSAGNLICKIYVTGNDTTIDSFAVFKGKVKALCEKVKDTGNWRYVKHYLYDNAGNQVESYEVSSYDTSFIRRGFDAHSKLIKEAKYRNSELTSYITLAPKPDGGIVLTSYGVYGAKNGLFTDIFGSGPDRSCPYESKTVTLFDKDSNIICDTEFTYHSSYTDTSITVNKYHPGKTKLILDSALVTTHKYLFRSKSVRLFDHKFDANGNLVEETNDRLERHLWQYNKANKLLEDAQYKPCSDEPISIIKNIYYHNGKSVKEHFEGASDNILHTFYGKDGRRLKVVGPAYHHKISETEYEYIE